MPKRQNGILDAVYTGAEEVRTHGRAIGWYAVDDSFKPILGPFRTKEECQTAIRGA